MKKIIISMLLIFSGYTLLAQNPSTPDSANAQSGITSDTTNAQGAMTSDSTIAQPVTSDTTNAQGAMTSDTTNAQAAITSDTTNAQGAMVSDSAKSAMPSNNMNNVTTNTANNNRSMAGTTTDASQTRFAALPVLVTAVPESIVGSVKNKYAANIYDITGLKNSAGQDVYMVRVLDNGQLRSEYVGSDGNAASK